MQRQTQNIANSTTRPPRRWRRGMLWLSLAAVCLLVVVAVAGEIIFLTNIPRNLVVKVLETQLHLRVTAKSLSTGWLGHTTLQDVTFTLPLADKAFLTIPELQVEHSPLPWILITQSMTIRKISTDHAELDVLQESGGNWNVEQVVRMLSHPESASPNTKTTDNSSPPQLPELQVNDATLFIADYKHRSATITDLSLHAKSDGPLVWQLQATVPRRLNITGKVAPGGSWAHEIDLTIWNAGSWASPWIKAWPASAQLAARWVGEIDGGQINARLQLENAAYGNSSIHGPVEISAGDGKATLVPRGLRMTVKGYDAMLDDGQIIIDADQVRTQGLSVQFAGGRATIDGKAALATGAASIQAAWRDVALPASASQSGDLSLEFTPTLNEPRIKATLNSRGSISAVSWTAQVIVDGGGKTLRALSVSARAPELMFQTAGHKAVDLSGLTAQLDAAGDNMYLLREIRLGSGQPIAGTGGYNGRDKKAWLALDGRGWTVPGTSSLVLDADLDVWATTDRIHLQQLYLRDGLVKTYAQGDYILNVPKPVNGRVYVTKVAAITPQQPRAVSPGGSIVSEFDLTGTVRPINLAFKGNASGSDVTLGARSLGDLKLVFDGAVHDDRRNFIRVQVESKDIQLLGGNWTVAGWWPVEASAIRFETVSVQHLSLSQLASRDDIAGVLDGKWSVDIKHFTPEGITIKGSAVVRDFACRKSPGGVPILAAEQIQIPSIQVQSGEVDIKSISVIHKQADRGRATIDLATTVAEPNWIWLSVDADSWPIQPASLEQAMASVSVKGDLDADLKSKSVYGNLDLRTDVSWGQQSLASIQIDSDLLGRRIQTSQIQIQSIGGVATGDAAFNLDQPLNTHADLSWTGVDLSRLQGFWPRFKDISGLVDGSIQVHPATTPRPLEPLQVTMHVEPRNVQLANIKIGPAQLFGYIGGNRCALDDSPERSTQVAMAGGTVSLWGRISTPAEGIYQSLVQVNLENIDLDAIVPKGSKIGRTPGLLDGNITVVAEPRSPDLTYGEGQLTVSSSDLAGIGPVSFLYNLMHVGHDPNKPEGNGNIDFTFQGQTIMISALRYFDRGTELRASGYINNDLDVPHSWVEMTAVGSLRPFGSINLPGLADLDNVLGAVQHDALAIKISGYMDQLDDPRATRKILFSSIGNDLQNLLFGDAKSTKQQPSE